MSADRKPTVPVTSRSSEADLLTAWEEGAPIRSIAARSLKSYGATQRALVRARNARTAAALAKQDENRRRKADAEKKRRDRIKRHEHAVAMGHSVDKSLALSAEEFAAELARIEAEKIEPSLQERIDRGEVIYSAKGCEHRGCSCSSYIATYWTRIGDTDYLERTGGGSEITYAQWLDERDAIRAAEVERRIREHARERARLAI